MTWNEETARRAGALAGALVAVGIATAATVSPTWGGVVTVAGWALSVFALHRFGRAGSS